MQRIGFSIFIAVLISFHCSGCVGGVSVGQKEKEDEEYSEALQSTKTSYMGALLEEALLRQQQETAASELPANQFSIYTAPIILVHGLSGFVNIGPLEYFNGVKEHLSAKGYRVHATKTDPFGSIESRAAQLKTQIEDYLDSINYPKAILVGHSMGGLDARWVASPQGGNSNRIAVIVSIGTPHRGTHLADWGLSVAPAVIETLLNEALTALGLAPRGIEKLEALHDLKVTSMAAFNNTYKNNPQVKYYSVGGAQTKLTGMNLALWASHDIVWLKHPSNDGLVPLSSSKWGHYLGDIAADHADQIGILTLWNHKQFYQNVLTYVLTNYEGSSYNDQHSN